MVGTAPAGMGWPALLQLSPTLQLHLVSSRLADVDPGDGEAFILQSILDAGSVADDIDIDSRGVVLLGQRGDLRRRLLRVEAVPLLDGQHLRTGSDDRHGVVIALV